MQKPYKSAKHKKVKAYYFGYAAEFIAITYLKLKFYKIISHRYKQYSGEIDIIAKKGQQLIFIEVKARARAENVYDLVSYNQQQRIVNTADVFISRNRNFSQHNIRFDLITVSNKLKIQHIKGFL